MFYLLTANQCGLNHKNLGLNQKETWFKTKKPVFFCFFFKSWFFTTHICISSSTSFFQPHSSYLLVFSWALAREVLVPADS
jgi:hypothetical protein